MMRKDQTEQIRAMANQGYDVSQIASAVGVETGDVASVLASVTLGMNEEGSNVVTVRLVAFPFKHDTPGLAAGVVAYTPKVGEVLLMAWLSVVEAWNGTTPHGDFGSAALFGLEPGLVPAQDLTATDTDQGGLAQAAGNPWPSFANSASSGPGAFTTTDPLLMVVSTTGTPSGADPAATQGRGTLNLLIADPH